MSQPLVSILIPFKNTDAFISECITSIIHQTYPHWEAIFVDDHSNDSSDEIVKTFSEKDPRIQIYKNKGEGIILALQTAFENCNGFYITRMDSDDLMTPNRLEIMVHKLETYGRRHLALGQVKYFREDGLSNGYARYETWLNELTKTGTNYSEIYKECVIPSPCWMLHRDDFEACQGFEPNRYPEDYDLAFRFYEARYRCIPCEDILLNWRDYSNRTSRTHKHYAANYFLDIKVHYFIKLDYNPKRPLVLWGAGKKGKKVARLLLKKEIPFTWLCNNKKKIGKDIYKKTLLKFNHLAELEHPQCIITVANRKEQNQINAYLNQQEMQPMEDYFFFC
ncbi:glycosyltransferase family 2 protein [Winogradskyella aquimaris]|uniref:Glycosyltransferase family 2 protein n=1 Tax=Winogradskyella aquimaris TaxID=864074 RepID=A0ABU5EPS4_9FLAO|nr:glycosyltransferase family 2 protein [Winogradskyella aquimaris]MDY2586682.1 glycosyltransferase family 2 protein [Winogradskyella aquimaris]